MQLADFLTLAGILGSILAGFVGLSIWVAKSYLKDLREKLNDAEAKITELTHQKEIAERDSRDARREAHEAEMKRAAAVAQLEEAEKVRARWKAAYGELDTKARALDARFRELSKQKADLQAAHDQLRAKYETLVQVDAAKDHKIEGLITACQELEQQKTNATDALTKAEQGWSAARQRIRNRGKQIRELESQISGVLKQDGRVWETAVPAGIPAFQPLEKRRVPIISVLNLKGGVGKTTITANLGGMLGQAGKRVLMVDLDHQRSLSHLLLDVKDRKLLFQQGRYLQQFLREEVKNGESLCRIAFPVNGATNCQVIINVDPESDKETSLDDLEMHLMAEWLIRSTAVPDVRFLLRNALHSPEVSDTFDFVLLDCPPRLGTACVNAIAASDFVLVPVGLDATSGRSILQLMRHLRKLRDCGVARSIGGIGVMANLVPSRACSKTSWGFRKGSIEQALWETLRPATQQEWQEGQGQGKLSAAIRFFQAFIKQNVRFADAARYMDAHQRLFLAISKYSGVKEDFQALAKEVKEWIGESIGATRVSSLPGGAGK